MPRPFLATVAGVALLFAGLPLASVLVFAQGNSGGASSELTAALQTDTLTVDVAPSSPVTYGLTEDRSGCDRSSHPSAEG